MIVQLVNERNNNNNHKDIEIKDLKLANHIIKQDQIKQEQKIEELRKEVSNIIMTRVTVKFRLKYGNLSTKHPSKITDFLKLILKNTNDKIKY